MNLFLDVFKILWPSYTFFWIISICSAIAFWYGLTKIYTQIKFKLYTPILFATFISFMVFANGFLGLYNSQLLYIAQQKNSPQSPAQQNNQEAEMDPETKMKAEFLNKIEALLQAQKEVPKETRIKLFKQYAALFPNPAAKKQVYEAIKKVYTCQRYLWEDALASYKAKEAIKSDSRIACEKLSGEFFKREKLFPEAAIKNQDELISNIAARKRIPASDGKEMDLTEDMVRQGVDAQVTALRILSQIFEQKQ